MLAVKQLCVSYGRVRALDAVDLVFAGAGALHGVIGPNGAGKSTLIDAISGRRPPNSGVVMFEDEDITGRSVAWRRRRGMARSFQRTSIFADLTVREQIELIARHLGDSRPATSSKPWTSSTFSMRKPERSPMARSGASTWRWRCSARRARCC